MMRSRNMRISFFGAGMLLACLLAIGFYAQGSSQAQAQSSTQDITGLIQQLQQFQGTGQTGATPTEPQPGTQPGTQPGATGGSRQPIVENQFSTTTSLALQARQPGNMVQQGLAEVNGGLDVLVGDADPQPGFIFDTFQQIFLSITDALNNLISTLNLGFALGGIGGPGSGDGGLTFDGAVTSGQGTTTPLN